MRIPRHWAKASAVARPRGRGEFTLWVWRWSDESDSDARARAQRAAQECADRVTRHGGFSRDEAYGYLDRPLREAVVDAVDAAGNVITRNSYGCLVLNSPHAMFVDVDLARPGLGDRLRALLGRGAAAEAPARRALDGLREFLHRRPGWGARVYRTPAGLRYLFTHTTFVPAEQATLDAMRALGADPLYIRMCQAQQCFRARLTPKPWRCDVPRPPHRFPFADDAVRREFEAWLNRYQAVTAGFAACRFVESIGAPRVAPALAATVALHDARSGATESLPLA